MKRRSLLPVLAFLLTASLFAPLVATRARAAELIMMEQPGCMWCKRWREEIGDAYPRTEEGRRAPIRFVDITEPWPEDLEGIAPERLTPTFVLVEDGVEIARLRGYPGEHFFWPLLGEMLDKLPSAAKM